MPMYSQPGVCSRYAFASAPLLQPTSTTRAAFLGMTASTSGLKRSCIGVCFMFSVFECQPTVIGLREELKQLQRVVAFGKAAFPLIPGVRGTALQFTVTLRQILTLMAQRLHRLLRVLARGRVHLVPVPVHVAFEPVDARIGVR